MTQPNTNGTPNRVDNVNSIPPEQARAAYLKSEAASELHVAGCKSTELFIPTVEARATILPDGTIGVTDDDGAVRSGVTVRNLVAELRRTYPQFFVP